MTVGPNITFPLSLEERLQAALRRVGGLCEVRTVREPLKRGTSAVGNRFQKTGEDVVG
jgi:hypothetical protein